MNSPCYKCDDRELPCHDTCDKYVKYRAVMDDERKARIIFNETKNVIIEGCIRKMADGR